VVQGDHVDMIFRKYEYVRDSRYYWYIVSGTMKLVALQFMKWVQPFLILPPS
jgi:hypothetical protein